MTIPDEVSNLCFTVMFTYIHTILYKGVNILRRNCRQLLRCWLVSYRVLTSELTLRTHRYISEVEGEGVFLSTPLQLHWLAGYPCRLCIMYYVYVENGIYDGCQFLLVIYAEKNAARVIVRCNGSVYWKSGISIGINRRKDKIEVKKWVKMGLCADSRKRGVKMNGQGRK